MEILQRKVISRFEYTESLSLKFLRIRTALQLLCTNKSL